MLQHEPRLICFPAPDGLRTSPATCSQVLHSNGTISLPVYTAEPLKPPNWLATAGTYTANVTYEGLPLQVSALPAVQ